MFSICPRRLYNYHIGYGGWQFQGQLRNERIPPEPTPNGTNMCRVHVFLLLQPRRLFVESRSAGKLRAMLRNQYVSSLYRHHSVQLMAQFRLMRIYIIFNIRDGSLSILARPSAQGLELV